MSAVTVAAAQTPDFLVDIVALLVGGALIAYLGARAGLLPIVAFLVAGILVGPNALGVVSDPEVIDGAAEIGVILLLFTIGLEFNLQRLARIARVVFLGGGLQVGIAGGLTTALCLAFGVGVREALFTGGLVALSSTAIVLALLSGRGEIGTERGRLGVGLLIFQDLAIIPMVLLAPMLGGQGGSLGEILLAVAGAVAMVVAVLVIARRLMPPLLELVARTCSAEVFLITVVAICFGTAFVTSLAGVSVSLGAFLAGLIVAESRLSQQALGEILPLQILFSGIFFASVGMLLDLSYVVDNLPLVIGAIAAVVAIKLIATAVSVRALGYSLPLAGAVALMLAQVGEFSFVLERVGADEGLRPVGSEDGRQLLIAVTVLLMMATPPLMTLSRRMAGDGLTAAPPQRTEPGYRGYGVAAEVDLRDHVILAGYGDGAREAAAQLRAAGEPFVITTLNPGGAHEALEDGFEVLQGDPSKSHLLERAGIDSARSVVVADDELDTAFRVVSTARLLNPEVDILVRAASVADVGVLAEAGADRVVAADAAGARSVGLLAAAASGADGIETERVLRFAPRGETCEHLAQVDPLLARSAGCADCLRTGDSWVHLRVCLDCGHVGCCDSSPNRHASRHHRETAHPAVASAEPGEGWAWCFVDRLRVESEPLRPARHGEPVA